jgi:Tfp pilus assembly protein PilV
MLDKEMPDRCIDNKLEDGFILSEILVAMVVLAIAAIGFLQTVQYAATRMHMAKISNTQITLALSLMEDATQQDLYDIKNGEGFDEKSNQNWRIAVVQDKERQSQSYEQPGIKTITVEVWKTEAKTLKLTSAKWAGR